MTGLVNRVRNTLRGHPRAEWVIAVFLCAVLLGQLLLSIRQLSQTADESTHLYSGYRYLKCGDLTISPEHPPLAKVVAAAPLLAMTMAVNCSPFEGNEVQQSISALNWLYSQNWGAALLRARTAASIFAVGLCVLVWMVARRMFGLATAVAAAVMLIFEPNILAYGALVMTDIPVACMSLFAVFGFYLWVKSRTVPFLLLTGLTTGLALLTKHSAVLLIPTLGMLAIADALIEHANPRSTANAMLRNLLAVTMICAVAVGVVWGGYVRVSVSSGARARQNASLADSSATAHFLFLAESTHVLPQPYLEGIATATSMSYGSPAAFLAGRIFPRAPWFSVPFYLLIRNTAAMLVMFSMAVFGMAIIFGERRREVLFLVIPLAVFLAACLRSSLMGGIRYLLPVFPFLLIAVAAGCVELARQVRWLRYAVPCLIFLHAVSSLHAYPNYLSYANEFWGGPSKAYRYLPWLDSGQAYRETKTYLERHPGRNCWLITGWQWDPGLYRIPCQTFGLYLPTQIPPRVQGTIIVSSTLITDVRLPEVELATPFKNVSPKDTLGGSALLVYEGDFDTRLDASKGERDLMVRAFAAGQPSLALEHGQRAIEFAPDSALAHSDLCTLLSKIGQMNSALNECSVALNIVRHDPLREEPARKRFLESLEGWISTNQATARK